MSCIQTIKKYVTVLELVVFLFMYSLFMIVITSQELYIWKACRVNFNYTEEICKNISNHKDKQIDVQKFVAEIQGYNGILQSIPAIVFSFFAGPLSDDYGRKPLILIGFTGYVILNISFLINSWFMLELPVEFLLFECLQDLFGGDIVFQLGIYALIVDRTPEEDRTRRMSILQATLFLGMTSGFITGGPIQKMAGWSGLYLTSMTILMLNFLVVIFLVKEPKRTKKPVTNSEENLCLRITKQSFNAFKNLFRKRPHGTRVWLCTFFIMLNMERFFQAGTYVIHLLFIKIQYGRGMEIMGMVFGIFTILSLISQLILIPIMSKKLRDTSIIIFALLTSIVGYIIFALGKTVPVLIGGYSCFAFYASINACSRSIVSKLVNPTEIGALFSMIGITQSVMSLLSKPFFATLYKNTVALLPGTYLLVVAGGLSLILIPISFAHVGLKKVQAREEAAKLQQNKEEAKSMLEIQDREDLRGYPTSKPSV